VQIHESDLKMHCACLRSGEDFGEDFSVKRDKSHEKRGGIAIRKNCKVYYLLNFRCFWFYPKTLGVRVVSGSNPLAPTNHFCCITNINLDDSRHRRLVLIGFGEDFF